MRRFFLDVSIILSDASPSGLVGYQIAMLRGMWSMEKCQKVALAESFQQCTWFCGHSQIQCGVIK